MGAEDRLSLELVQALGGTTPQGEVHTTEWKVAKGLPALLSGEGSCNIPKLRFETRRLHGKPDGVDFWRTVFALERSQWMISEFGSSIYREWHLLPAASAMSAPEADVAKEALEWCAYYLALSRLLEVDGRIMWPGQRSAGHVPLPAIHEWVYAMATGGNVRRAEAWCRAANAGLKKQWEFAAVQKLLPNLRRANERSLELTLADLGRRGFRRPLRVYRTDQGGVAAWIEPAEPTGWSCDNSNTPPIVAGIRHPDGSEAWFPAGGGVRDPRIRERFDHCRVSKEGDRLRYASDIYGEDSVQLPAGHPTTDITLGLPNR